MNRSIWIGYDPREVDALTVTHQSIRRRLRKNVPIFCLNMDDLRAAGVYWREHERRGHGGAQLWDVISEAPMATEFAISRFLVPHLARQAGHIANGDRWALFMDCDMLARDDINHLFDACDPRRAVMCVKHRHEPPEGVKMDGQAQTRYARKNWSSVCAFNLDHPKNARLTPDMVNSLPGRDLHGFCWLDEDDIGDLMPCWNYLVGHTDIRESGDPRLVHFTDGIPSMPGYETSEFSDEWWYEYRNLGRMELRR